MKRAQWLRVGAIVLIWAGAGFLITIVIIALFVHRSRPLLSLAVLGALGNR